MSVRGIRIAVPVVGKTFSLNGTYSTSCGVYDRVSGNKICEVWGCKTYGPGTHQIAFDGKMDDGTPLDPGSYRFKVERNQLTAKWAGVEGNTSVGPDSFGETVRRSFQFPNSLAIVGNKAFEGRGYSEVFAVQTKFLLDDIQKQRYISCIPRRGVLQCTEMMDEDSDGIVYIAGSDYGDRAGHSWVSAFSAHTEQFVPFYYSIPLQMESGKQMAYCAAANLDGQRITGFSVQKTGIYLFVARTDRVEVYLKASMLFVRSILIPSNRIKCGIDNNLWIENDRIITKYDTTGGYLADMDITLSGLVDPLGMDVSPNGATISVIDGGSSQQVKHYNATTGAHIRSFGDLDGYHASEVVNDHKFYFNDLTGTDFRSYNPLRPFIKYRPDGGYIVGDAGNYRMQFYAADDTWQDRVQFMQHCYGIEVNQKDPTRSFNEYLEFKRDFSVPLDNGTNGSWTQVANWRGNCPPEFFQDFIVNVFKSITDFENPAEPEGAARTFGFLRNVEDHKQYVAELKSGGFLIHPISFGVFGNEQFDIDGNIIYKSISETPGGFCGWYRRMFLGYDENDLPTWGAATLLASIAVKGEADPVDTISSVYIFPDGKIASFDYNGCFGIAWEILDGIGRVNYPERYVPKHHVGIINPGGTTWAAKMAYATGMFYNGDFPLNGRFEDGSDTRNAGGDIAGHGDIVVNQHHGEFYKFSQSNMYAAFSKIGLPLIVFGTTTPDHDGQDHPQPAMAGNALMLKVNRNGNSLHVRYPDEGAYNGIGNFEIENLDTIAVEEIDFDYPPALIVSDGSIDLMAGQVLNFPNKADPNHYLIEGNGWMFNNIVGRSGIKSCDRKLIDIDLYFNSIGTAITERDLETTGPLSNWKLPSLLNWDYNDRNAPNNSKYTYIDILDNTGKRITRFFPLEYSNNTQPDSYTDKVITNGITLAEGDSLAMYLVFKKSRYFEVSAENGLITFKYADFNPLTTATLSEAGANWAYPKTLRITQYIAGDVGVGLHTNLTAPKLYKNY